MRYEVAAGRKGSGGQWGPTSRNAECGADRASGKREAGGGEAAKSPLERVPHIW
jgi:hypothetical protein